ncbi:MAG: N-acetyl-gamma-glutamyl-phosphate reductase [Phycisphaerales bacterium]
MSTIRTVIVGATGYSGGELASILLRHPRAEIVGLFGSSRRADAEKQRMGDLHPRLRSLIDMEVRPADPRTIAAVNPAAVFLATPHEASLELAAELLGVTSPPRVFDLSGAFRLAAEQYPRVYGFTHGRPDLLAQAAYGLPELNRAALGRADLVAVPGCYATSAIIPLAPLARAGAIAEGARPIIDATSGVSGAGRSPTARTHLSELSLQPYGVFSHRHTPEIERYAGTPVVFTPHLGAYDRGILSTIHIALARGWDRGRVTDTMNAAYGRERFIRLLPAGEWPSIAAVRHTNYCDLGWACDDRGHLIVVSALDNLVKGAAGQAVQCLNIRFDLPEHAGLDGVPL